VGPLLLVDGNGRITVVEFGSADGLNYPDLVIRKLQHSGDPDTAFSGDGLALAASSLAGTPSPCRARGWPGGTCWSWAGRRRRPTRRSTATPPWCASTADPPVPGRYREVEGGVGMPDDLDRDDEMFVLATAPPAPAGRSRRRIRTGLVVVAAGVVAAAGIAALIGEDSDRTDVVDRPVPTTSPRLIAPAPGRDPGGVAGPPQGTPQAPAPPRVRGPVLEDLALRADGGVGRFAFGTPRDDVLRTATGVLGDPALAAQPVTTGSACAGPGWTTVQRTNWGDIGLTFAGPAADDLRLVGWNVVARPGAARRFRMAGGPVLGDPLTTWGAAYGDALDVERLAGDAGQSRVTIRLPDGDVQLVGYAEASGNAVVARGGPACR
jgi:hypothetical protein